MPNLTGAAELLFGSLFFLCHLGCVALTNALRAYSRSRLEELCEQRGRRERADEIARDDVVTERAAEFLGALAGFLLAGLLAVMAALNESSGAIAVCILLGLLGHLLATVLGRAFAESIIDVLWPIARIVRHVAFPFTFVLRQLEAALERRARGGNGHAARPASVEVEIHSRTADESQEIEPELPDATRAMLERAAALADRDVASIMTPRSSILVLPENVGLDEAARAFIDSGLSRVPLYGEHRDDMVGVLYLKDLTPYLTDRGLAQSFQARKLARPPVFVPETKVASELLDELRHQRVQMAIVLDEYGTVSGLITLEDLLEAIVGPIDDEHDPPTPGSPVEKVAEDQYEVDAAVALEALNDQLGLDLPTDGDFQTLGGLVFDTLGRVPEQGDTFQAAGAEFTVLDVADHVIRRLRINLKPASARQPS